VGLFVICGFFLLLPAVNSGGSPIRSQCTNNLKQIGLGLQNYADVYRCFPPAYTTDAAGKPMHSWRVLILPFIEQQALYKRYDFNEPWDGPNNSLLAKEMPIVFHCPADKANPGTLTDYVAIVGPETIWQANRGATFDEVTDGSSNTIAVVEATGLGVNWMEPRDLPFSAVANGINPKQGPGMASQHPGAVIAVFADGHTQTIQQNLSRKLLRAICTKDGCEEIDAEF
jgi:prepilin-type processing-associated H-X9-DG protein